MGSPLLRFICNSERLLVMGDKYDAPAVLATAFLHLRDRPDTPSAYTFGAAVAFGNLDLARLALKKFDHTFIRKLVRTQQDESYGQKGFTSVSGSTRRLSEVPEQFIERFGRTALLSFAKIQEGVCEGSWTWKNRADQFVVSRLSTPPPSPDTFRAPLTLWLTQVLISEHLSFHRCDEASSDRCRQRS